MNERFNYTKIYPADKVSESKGCIYNDDLYRCTGAFAVEMGNHSFAAWNSISVDSSGFYTVMIKYSSSFAEEVLAELTVNSDKKYKIKFIPCTYYATTKKEYHSGNFRCARANVYLEKGENKIALSMQEYCDFGSVAVDTVSVTDGRLSEMKQPVYDVLDYGAVGDGVTDNTEVFQHVLKLCANTGGTMYVHDGCFLIRGVTVFSNTVVYVDESASVLGSDNQEEYLLHTVKHTYIQEYRPGFKALFYAVNCHDITITGGGTIGIKNGDTEVFTGHEWERPTVITFISCTDVVLHNIDIRESGSWIVIFLECEKVITDSINIDSRNHINRDGIDVVDSHEVSISNCCLLSGDDVICPKSGTYKGVVDLHVKNCALSSCGANGIKFGSSSYQSMKDCTFEDVLMTSIHLAGISLGSADGADVENIVFNNIKISEARVPISILNGGGVRGRRIDGSPEKKGYMRDIVLENIYAHNLIENLGSHIDGRNINGSDDRVNNITLKNVNLICSGGYQGAIPACPPEYNGEYPDYYWCEPLMPAYALYVRHTDNIRLIDCTFQALSPDVREAVIFEDSTYSFDMP